MGTGYVDMVVVGAADVEALFGVSFVFGRCAPPPPACGGALIIVPATALPATGGVLVSLPTTALPSTAALEKLSILARCSARSFPSVAIRPDFSLIAVLSGRRMRS